MIIHNATFMMPLEREADFLPWLRSRIAGMAPLCNPRVSAMREAGGIDYRHAEAQSVAFQTEFESMDAARAWSASAFADLAVAFDEEYGPQAMVFVSMFEHFPLENGK